MNDGINYLGFFALAISVLLLAASTTRKNKMLNVLAIIISSLMVVVNFYLTITEYTILNIALTDSASLNNFPIHSLLYFTISLFMLVGSIFSLIYLINNLKNRSNTKLLSISFITTSSLVLLFLVVYLTFSIIFGVSNNDLVRLDNILLLGIYSLISICPLLILR
jgi:amino acid permease